MKVIKVFLHISKDEQLKRLKSRLDSPDKHWKFDVSDIREREYWHDYRKAYEETLSNTDSEYAPWHIIPANNKWYARLKFSEILVKTLEDMKLTYPMLNPELKKSIERARKELEGKG